MRVIFNFVKATDTYIFFGHDRWRAKHSVKS